MNFGKYTKTEIYTYFYHETKIKSWNYNSKDEIYSTFNRLTGLSIVIYFIKYLDSR